MADARLEVTDALGRRIVPISKTPFEIGRRETNDLRLAGSEVSRDHAEIAIDGSRFKLHDRNSRYGTYVNGEQVTERVLAHGDKVRLGRTGGAEMVFLLFRRDVIELRIVAVIAKTGRCERLLFEDLFKVLFEERLKLFVFRRFHQLRGTGHYQQDDGKKVTILKEHECRWGDYGS